MFQFHVFCITFISCINVPARQDDLRQHLCFRPKLANVLQRALCTDWQVPCGEKNPKSCLGRKNGHGTKAKTCIGQKKAGYHFHIKFIQICCKNRMARNFCAVNFAKESNMDARTLGAQLSSNIYPHCMKQDAAHEPECRREEHFVKNSLHSKCFPSNRTSAL